MRGSVLNIVRFLVDDISYIKSRLQQEYEDVYYLINAKTTKGGHFAGVNYVEFVLTSRRHYCKVLYPIIPYIVEVLRDDVCLPFEKRQFHFTRVSFLDRIDGDLKQNVLRLWY